MRKEGRGKENSKKGGRKDGREIRIQKTKLISYFHLIKILHFEVDLHR